MSFQCVPSRDTRCHTQLVHTRVRSASRHSRILRHLRADSPQHSPLLVLLRVRSLYDVLRNIFNVRYCPADIMRFTFLSANTRSASLDRVCCVGDRLDRLRHLRHVMSFLKKRHKLSNRSRPLARTSFIKELTKHLVYLILLLPSATC